MIAIKVYLIGCAISLIFTVTCMMLELRDEVKEKGVVKISIEDISVSICALMFCTLLSFGIFILFLYLNKDIAIFTLKDKKHDKNRN